MEPITTAPPLDVLWFYLPRRPEDHASAGAIFRLGHGGLLVLMEHVESWQVGYIIAKGKAATGGCAPPAFRRYVVDWLSRYVRILGSNSMSFAK
jgi:hypothetical protein